MPPDDVDVAVDVEVDPPVVPVVLVAVLVDVEPVPLPLFVDVAEVLVHRMGESMHLRGLVVARQHEAQSTSAFQITRDDSGPGTDWFGDVQLGSALHL